MNINQKKPGYLCGKYSLICFYFYIHFIFVIKRKRSSSIVSSYGLSDKLGLIYWNNNENQISANIMNKIDNEIIIIVNQCMKQTRNIIIDNHNSLEYIADELLEKESITGDRVNEIVKQNKSLNSLSL